MKKNFSLVLIALLLMLVLATGLIACDKPEDPPTGPTMYTVTIDLQDGSTPTTQQVEEGNTIALPTVTGTEYKTFKGWSTTADGSSIWLKTNTVTSDITIYACYNQLVAKVTFNYNYTGSPKQISEQMPLGQAITFPADPTRQYWIFNGWFTDAEATEDSAFDRNSILTGALKLYAGWIIDPAHTHSFDVETTPATCTEDGFDRHTCVCGTTYDDNIVSATGHSFTFSDTDYFGMVYCNNGCKYAERKESLRIYEDDFVYTFDAAKEQEIFDRYRSMITFLENTDRYDAALHSYDGINKTSEFYLANQEFEAIFNAFYDDLMYIIEQYQYAYVFYCVDEAKYTMAYEKISEYRTDAVSDFYALYRLIYETALREFFFDMHEGGWTEEDIQMALTLSDSYGSADYADINKRISEIEVEFRDLDDPTTGLAMPKLYEEFVGLNNQIAALAGYDNYIEYAYENVYNRDYSPEDTAIMRNYVKTYLKDVYTAIYEGYRATQSGMINDAEAKAVWEALSNKSIFSDKVATDLVKAYFDVMTSPAGGAGDTAIDFYYHANELFKNGNYYTGAYEGAFSYWIGAQDTSILYFGPGSYSGAFTFVHEFGHYYNNIYNPDVSFSYDIDEVHSQANEMMFLSFLNDYLPEEVANLMYDKVYYDTLFNNLAIVMLATAVDEFEYCVYAGKDLNGNDKQYTARDYDKLFTSIMQEYGIDKTLVTYYWRYVVIEAPCYYISYAMSALPCIELLAIAETDGFEVAQGKYLKFFTFTDDPDNVEIDEMGDKVITIGYGDTLKYAGLDSVFEETMYTKINSYFIPEE